MTYPEFVQTNLFIEKNPDTNEAQAFRFLLDNVIKIHQITTKNYDNFESLIKEYLEEGLSIFGMEIGIVSEIKGDEYIICNALSPDGSLNKGDVFELEGTYCREVYKSKKILGFPHVGSMDDMKDHPVYVNMKLESYISAPLFKGDKLFGTLNFTSTKIRNYGFSDHERVLISLMANSISDFLVLKDQKDQLRQLNQRQNKLIGYVAHDLRNHLGNISSLMELLLSPQGDEEKTQYISMAKSCAVEGMEVVQSILEYSAFSDGKILLQKEKCSLEQIIEDVLKRYRDQAESRGIAIELKLEKMTWECDPGRMKQVFSNLISNAIKYSHQDQKIEISLGPNNEKGIHFKITNSIDSDKIIKRGSVGSELGSSLGFGLEIVSEILNLHQSKLIITSDDKIYTAGFTLS